jgi:uncharacterized protein YqgC (DUF456 family)
VRRVVAAFVLLAMLVGLVGTVVPVLPGLALITAAAAVYGVVEGFGEVPMVLIVVLGVAGTVAGVVLPSRAAGGAGAARSSLVLGAVLGIVGFFVVPVIGLPLGGALGIYVGERGRTGAHEPAWRATAATLKGFGIGALVQLAAGILMIAVWLAWWLA